MSDKAAEMAKVSAKGGFNLFWGLILSTLISAVGVVILARVLSPQNYGLYTIALSAPSLIATFRDWGMNSAMIKYTAQFSAEQKLERVRGILLAGLIFEVALGLSLSFVSFLLSGFIAADIFKRPITTLIQISSLTILGGAFLTAAQAAFTGREQLKPNSVTLVFWALFRSVLSPVLVFVGFGVSGAVLGYVGGSLGGGLVGVALLMEIYNGLGKKGVSFSSLKIWETFKFMFKYALPLSFSAFFNSFLAQFYNVIIAVFSSNYLVGNYAVATNFTILLTFFASPITTMLFPAFSKLDANKDRDTIKIVFKSSIKYASLLVIPPTVAVMALAVPTVFALFGERYADAPLFLALLALNYILTAFGQLSTLNLISGQGETRFYLKLAIVNTVTGIVLAVLLVPTLGVPGLIITTIFDGVPGLALSLKWIKQHYDATVDWVSSGKILFSSAVPGALVYAVITFLTLNVWIKLILGLLIFTGVFLMTLIASHTLRKLDIENLRLMTSGLGPIGNLINPVLSFLERLINFSNK